MSQFIHPKHEHLRLSSAPDKTKPTPSHPRHRITCAIPLTALTMIPSVHERPFHEDLESKRFPQDVPSHWARKPCLSEKRKQLKGGSGLWPTIKMAKQQKVRQLLIACDASNNYGGRSASTTGVPRTAVITVLQYDFRLPNASGRYFHEWSNI